MVAVSILPVWGHCWLLWWAHRAAEVFAGQAGVILPAVPTGTPLCALGQPQTTSLVFAVPLWLLVLQAVSAYLSPKACPWVQGKQRWGIWVSWLPSVPACPCPREAASQRAERCQGWGVFWGSTPAYLLQAGTSLAEPGAICRARRRARMVPAHSRSPRSTGSCWQVPQQVPHHLAGGGGGTLRCSQHTPQRRGAQAARICGALGHSAPLQPCISVQRLSSGADPCRLAPWAP